MGTPANIIGIIKKVDNTTDFTFPATPFGVYSLRKYSGYGGYAIKVRRSSDDSTSDIGFINDILDTSSLLAFVGANNGYIEKWYDQSSFNRNIEQTNVLYQPKIVSSGVLITAANGLPAIDFLPPGDGVHLLFPSGLLNGATEVSLFAAWSINNGANDGVFGPSNTNSVGLEILTVTVASRPTFLRINGTIRNDNAGAAYQMWNDSTTSLTSFIGNSSSVIARKNGSGITLTDSGAMPSLDFNGQYALGLYNDLGNSMGGNVQEFVLFSSDQTANVSTIETMINSYYAIY